MPVAARRFLGRDRRPWPRATDRSDPMLDLPHVRNFVKAVRGRRPAELTAEVAEGHKSAVLRHRANAAYRLGRAMEFDPQVERFVHDPEAHRLLTRAYRGPYVIRDEV
jgi:hypothetical protein